MGALFSLLVGIPIGAGIVMWVKRILERHEPTREEQQRAISETIDQPHGAQLPTLTTEGTERVPRDPEFELDANAQRNRQA